MAVATDAVIPRNLLNASTASGSFNAYADVNGNGIIQATDAVVPQNALNTSLPAGNPAAGVFASNPLLLAEDGSVSTPRDSLLITADSLLI